MTNLKEGIRYNEEDCLVLSGDLVTEGSKCFGVDPDTGFSEIQTVQDEILQPGPFQTGPDTLWVGPVGIATLGHHLATELLDSHLHFHVHSEFADGLSTTDAQVLNAYNYLQNISFQPDDSAMWLGTKYSFQITPGMHTLLDRLSVKTSSTPATKYVKLRVWQGIAPVGRPIFSQKYPASDFAADTEVELTLRGDLEFDSDTTYYFEYSSSEPFSLRTNAAGTFCWMMVDFSMIREDNLLQTKPWEDGGPWDSGDYFIDSRKIYKTHVTGVQSGTFESNFDKWSELASKKYVEEHIAAIQESDPVFSLWDKSTGIIISESQISDLQPYLLSESDPIFSVSPAGGISIQDIVNWNNKLDSYTETDPIFSASPAFDIDAQDITNWDEAYSWGDHGAAGYVESVSFTEGSIPFSDANGKLIEDNPNLRFDDKFHVDVPTVLEGNLVSKLSDGVYIGRSRIASTPWRQDDSTGWQTWTAQELNPGTGKRWRSCDMSGDGKYQVAVGNEGQKVWVSADYGQTWNAYGNTRNYMGVACSADGKYMTAGVINGYICISSDYGLTWIQSSSATVSWVSIAMDATGQHQVATCGGDAAEGDIYLSHDYGVTWAAQGLPLYHRDGVAMSSDGRYIMCTEGETQEILKSEDYGATWATTGPGVGRTWADIAMSSDGKYVIINAGSGGAVRISDDYGSSWKTATGCPNSYWYGVGISGSGKYMVAGGYTLDEIYMSDDFGDNFSPVSGTVGDWDDFAMSQDGMYRLAAADGKDLFTAHGGGAIIYGDVNIADGDLSIANMTAGAIPFIGLNGKLSEAPTDLFYDALSYLHSPKLAIFDDDPILKRGHGLSLIFSEETEFEIVHVNTPTKSAFFKYNPSIDKFSFDKALQVNGSDVLTSESDPVFSAWNKSDGISITESQISDLQAYLLSESDPIFTAWDKSTGVSITESQISDLQSYLTEETDPIFMGWDKSAGISITESQISDLQAYLLSETDPVFSAWDKSTGISINESQISDLQAYLLSETDPVFTSWDKSTGVSITQSQLSDLSISEGYIAFGDVTGKLIDDSKLFWDKVNNRLALGLSNPARMFHMQDNNATIRIDRDTNSPAVMLHRFPSGDWTTPWKGFMFRVDATGPDDGSFAITDYHQNVSGGGDTRLEIDTDGKIDIPGALAIGGIISGDGSGLTGLTESQITDLQSYLISESDPVFLAWDKSTGISITESQISDLSHTPAFDGDIAEIFNSAGILKIMPGAQYDTEFFGDTDVADNENSKILKMWRRAPEGNDYIRFYISSNRTAYIHASNVLTLQAQNPFIINSVTEDITFKVGDNDGVKKFYFKDSDNNTVAVIDSKGVLTLDKNNGSYLNLVRGTVNKINNFFDSTYTDLRFEGEKDYNRIGTWIDKPFQIVTNSVERIKVANNGYVGFGIFGATDPKEEVHIKSDHPTIAFEESDAASNEKVWEFGASNEEFSLKTANDSHTGTQTVIKAMNRSGTSVGLVVIPNAKFAVGTETASGELTVDQSNASGAIPVLTLDQGDVDQPFIEFLNGTIYTGKNGQDQYLKVKLGANTRYLRLFN